MSPKAQSYAIFFAVAMVWGVNWPIMKVAVGLMSPWWFATSRVGLGCFSAFLFLFLVRRLVLPSRADWPVILSVGLLQLGLAQLLIHVGLSSTTAGRSAILTYSTPIWVLPGAYLFLGERLNWRGWVGFFCGLAGLIYLIDASSLITNWAGNLFLIGASVAWAVAILHSRAHRWHLPADQLLPWQLLIGFLLMLPVSYLVDGPIRADWDASFLYWALLYNGPIATAFAVWGIVLAQKNLPAVTASITFLIVPAIGIFASFISLGEVPGIRLLVGFGFILLGTILSALRGKPSRQASMTSK